MFIFRIGFYIAESDHIAFSVLHIMVEYVS